MGRVGQFQHRLADDLAGALRTEADILVAVGRDDGKLLDDEPVEVRALSFLTGHEIEDCGSEIGQQNSRARLIFL